MDKLTYKVLREKLRFDFQSTFFCKQILIDLLSIATIVALFQSSYAVINVFLISCFMFRQFSFLHEAVHGLSHPKNRFNSAMGIIAGTFCLTPFSPWKVAHLKHHYWTGNLDQDPTFSILKSFNQSSHLKKRAIESTWRRGIPLFAALQHLNFWIFGIKNAKSFENLISIVVPVLAYGFIFSQLSLLNLIITATGVMFYFRIYEDMLFPQHVGLYSDDEEDHHPHHWEQPHVTRSWYLPPLIEKQIVMNMNYHTEHHLFPDLPWHELGKAHELLLERKEEINLINDKEWMKVQRSRPFAEVIVPIPSRKKNTA